MIIGKGRSPNMVKDGFVLWSGSPMIIYQNNCCFFMVIVEHISLRVFASNTCSAKCYSPQPEFNLTMHGG